MSATHHESRTRRKQTLAKKTMWSAAASLIAVACRMIGGVIVARFLGPTGSGEVAYYFWLCEITAVISGFGLPNAMTRFAAEMTGRGDVDSSAPLIRWLYIRFVLLVCAGALGLLLVGIARDVNTSTLIVVVVLFIMQALSTIYLASLAGRQQFDITARITGITSIIMILALAVFTNYWGLRGALLAYAVASGLPALLSLSLLTPRQNTVAARSFAPRKVVGFAFNTWLAAMVSAIVWSRMEVFFIERYRTSEEVAFFTTGISISMLATQLPLLLGSALFAHFSELSGAGDEAAIARTYTTGTRLLSFLLFPLSLGCAAITPVLLPLMYGHAFEPAVPSAVVLVSSGILSAASVGSSLLYGLGRSRFIAVFGFLGAALSVILALLIIPTYGVWGAVWTRSVVQSSMIAVTLVYITRFLKLPVPWHALLKTLLAAGACALAARVVLTVCPHPYMLPLSIMAGAGVYLVGVRLLGLLNSHDRQRFEEILQRLPFAVRLAPTHVLRWLVPVDY